MSETDTSARETLTHPPERRSGPCVDRPRRGAPCPRRKGGPPRARDGAPPRECVAVSASSSSPYITGHGLLQDGRTAVHDLLGEVHRDPRVAHPPGQRLRRSRGARGTPGSSDGCRLITRSGKRSRKTPVRMLIHPASTTSAGATPRPPRRPARRRAPPGRGRRGATTRRGIPARSARSMAGTSARELTTSTISIGLRRAAWTVSIRLWRLVPPPDTSTATRSGAQPRSTPGGARLDDAHLARVRDDGDHGRDVGAGPRPRTCRAPC